MKPSIKFKSKGKQQLSLYSQQGERGLKEQELEHPDHSDFFKRSLVMGLWKLHLWSSCLTKIKPVLSSPWNMLLINPFPTSQNIYNITCILFFLLPPIAFKVVSCFFWSNSSPEWRRNRMVGQFRELERNKLLAFYASAVVAGYLVLSEWTLMAIFCAIQCQSQPQKDAVIKEGFLISLAMELLCLSNLWFSDKWKSGQSFSKKFLLKPPAQPRASCHMLIFIFSSGQVPTVFQ